MEPAVVGQIVMLIILMVYLIIKIAKLPKRIRNIVLVVLGVSYSIIFIVAYNSPETIKMLNEYI